MNERQSQELQELKKLEAEGTLTEAQVLRLEDLNQLEALFTKAASAEDFEKKFKTTEAQKEHFRTKFEKTETERLALEAKVNAGGNEKKGLQVEDFIDISTSLEGLDQKEKERISREHKLTGKPLSEIRKDEDFLLWQSAYRSKVEKERQTIKPNSKQPDSDGPISLEEALAQAQTPAEKEKILTELGLYKESRPRSDRSKIGI